MAEVLDVKDMLPNRFEPKRKNRWLLRIEGIDAFLLNKAARPSIETEEVEIPFINSRRYVAGTTKFGEMSISLHDPIAPSGAQQVMEWIRLTFESVSGRAGYADFYKRNIELVLLDPVGTTIENWMIAGAWIKTANFGELDYASGAEAQMIELTIRYDNAVLNY